MGRWDCSELLLAGARDGSVVGRCRSVGRVQPALQSFRQDLLPADCIRPTTRRTGTIRSSRSVALSLRRAGATRVVVVSAGPASRGLHPPYDDEGRRNSQRAGATRVAVVSAGPASRGLHPPYDEEGRRNPPQPWGVRSACRAGETRVASFRQDLLPADCIRPTTKRTGAIRSAVGCALSLRRAGATRVAVVSAGPASRGLHPPYDDEGGRNSQRGRLCVVAP